MNIINKVNKNFLVFGPLIFIGLLAILFFSSIIVNKEKKITSLVVDKPLPNIRLTDLYQWDKFVMLGNLKPASSTIGQWYLINVWASWCEACKTEHTFLMELAKAGVVIYGIDSQDKVKDAQAWLTERGNPYQQVLRDASKKVYGNLGVIAVPETLLIDPKGIIRYRQQGPLTPEIWTQEWFPVIKAWYEKK